jgi:hypothetical protein
MISGVTEVAENLGDNLEIDGVGARIVSGASDMLSPLRAVL